MNEEPAEDSLTYKSFPSRENVTPRTVEAEIGARGGGNGNLRDSHLAGRGRNFDTVHRAVGDEDVLVGEIVDDVAIMGFTEGSVGG